MKLFKPKTIKCQDCGGKGIYTLACNDPMCRTPFEPPCATLDHKCTTCKATGNLVADECNRYWAVPYYSRQKKAADKKKAIEAARRVKRQEREWLAEKATELEKEAAKIRRKLKFLKAVC